MVAIILCDQKVTFFSPSRWNLTLASLNVAMRFCIHFRIFRTTKAKGLGFFLERFGQRQATR